MTNISTIRTPTRFAAVALFGLMAAACGGYTAQLATITVAPDANLSENSLHQFTAEGRDGRGAFFPIAPTWSVVAGGGTISDSGLFTSGTMPGSYPSTVKASYGVISGNASVTVTGPIPPIAPALWTITVTPAGPDTLPATTTRQFLAVGKDSAGKVVTFLPNWTVVAGGGSISNTGLFTAGTTPGIYLNTVKASWGMIAGYASLTVASTAASIATMQELVHFAYDKSDLTDDSRAALDSKVKVFQSNPAMRILIVGHTDDRGTGVYNMDLGTRRAEVVRDYLVAQGVATSRIELETRGESQPVASGSTEGAMALNRRDAFRILLVSDNK